MWECINRQTAFLFPIENDDDNDDGSVSELFVTESKIIWNADEKVIERAAVVDKDWVKKNELCEEWSLSCDMKGFFLSMR